MRLNCLIGICISALACGSSNGSPSCDGLGEAECSRRSGCKLLSSCCGRGPICASANAEGLCPPNNQCGQCAGLDEVTCSTRLDCVADRCPQCGSCQQSFLSCRALADAPAQCPGCSGQMCPQGCRVDTDCAALPGLQFCAAPGSSEECGTCQNPGPNQICHSDAECPSLGLNDPQICEPPACACDGTKTCTRGCVLDSECGVARVCQSNHRCGPMPCGAMACPTFFSCQGGYCARTTCSDDSGCPGGFCVDGACFDMLGTCRAPAAIRRGP
jgi:hypothetical protein